MRYTKTIRIDPDYPSLEPIREAAGLIRNGGVVVFPTTGLYGLGADALNLCAIERVFRIKQRPSDKPLSILIRDRASIDPLVQDVSPAAHAVMDHFWPGKLTVVLNAGSCLPEALTAQTGKIGLRVPAHPVSRALLNMLDGPLTATSANISGYQGCSRISALDSRIEDGVDLILDAGPLKGGVGTTVIDVSVDPPRVLREGAISVVELMESEILYSSDKPHQQKNKDADLNEAVSPNMNRSECQRGKNKQENDPNE